MRLKCNEEKNGKKETLRKEKKIREVKTERKK